MNRHMTIGASEALTNDNIYDLGFDLTETATEVGKATLRRQARGIAASILYADPHGARLYDAFVKACANGDPAESSPAKLISTHKHALASVYQDIERLVVVGGGSYDTFLAQEGKLLEEIHSTNSGKNNELEVVLIDVSREFLNDDMHALNDLGNQLGTNYKVIPICADFTEVSGSKFDDILVEHFNSKPRSQVRTGIISTGATFGNIEDIRETDSMPYEKIETRMALLGELGGMGSVVGFDCFSKHSNDTDYYDRRELRDFFVNGMEIIQRECRGLSNFLARDAGGEPLFRYFPKIYEGSRLLAHRLETTRSQTAILRNGAGDIEVTVDGTYHMMYSVRPRVDDITSRSRRNTGLTPVFDVSGGDGLSFFVFKKDKTPNILNVDEIEGSKGNESITAVPSLAARSPVRVGHPLVFA